MERTGRDTARRPTETDYIAIQKGRGYVYAFGNNIYARVKTEGNIKYRRCVKYSEMDVLFDGDG